MYVRCKPEPIGHELWIVIDNILVNFELNEGKRFNKTKRVLS